jgi:WD40 repeat protein
MGTSWYRAAGLALVTCLGGACSEPSPPQPTVPGSASAPDEVLPPESNAAIEFVPQVGHSGNVGTVAIAPGGRLMLTAATDRALKLWDVEHGKLVRTFPQHFGEDVVFSPDGTRFLASGLERGFKLWHVEGKLLLAVDVFADALAFSPDGKLAAALADELRVFDLESGAERWHVKVPERAKHVAFTADGKSVVGMFAGKGTTAIAWDAASGTPRGEPLAIAELFPQLTPTGLVAVRNVPGAGDRVILRDVVLRKDVASHALPGDPLKNVARFSSDGRAILVALSGVLEIRDLVSGKVRKLATGHFDPPSAWSSPDGRRLALDGMNGIEVWDVDGSRLPALPQGLPSVASVAISRDGRRLLTGRSGGSAALWDLPAGRMIHVLGEGVRLAPQVAFSPDGRSAVLASPATQHTGNPGKLELWDVATGTRLQTLDGHGLHGAEGAAFSPDGRTVVSAGQEDSGSGSVKLWDVASGTLVRTIPLKRADYLALSSDGRTIVAGAKELSLIDAASGEVTRNLGPSTVDWSAAAIAPDGRMIVTGTKGRGTGAAVAELWDLQGGSGPLRIFDHGDKNLSPVVGGTMAITSLSFSADGKRLLTTASDDTLRIWDVQSGDRLATLSGHTSFVSGGAITPDGRHVVTGSADGTSKIWDAASGKLLATLLSTGSDWIVWTPDGYFDASGRGAHLLAMVQGTRAFAIEQFASEFNRPDRVLAAIGLAAPEVIAHFEERHRIRLQRLGLRQAPRSRALHVPEARIAAARQDGRHVDLSIELTDRRVDLAHYNVYANGVPIHAGSGKRVSGRKVTLRERVPTTSGANVIEVSVTNARGAESFRAATQVVDRSRARGDLWFLGFGVSDYKDSRLDLGYAHKDVLDLARVLGKAGDPVFARVHIHTFVNAQATRARLRAAKRLLARATVDDTVVLFIAGHGVHARDRKATYYYLTHEAEVKRLAETAVSFDVVEDILEGIAPRRKLFLMDTCASGEIDEVSPPPPLELPGKRGVVARALRGLVYEAGGQAPRRAFLLQRDRFIYTDVSRRTGAIVLSSSRGGEYSYESQELENGYFTTELLAALTSNAADKNHDRVVSTSELRAYVTAAVSARSNQRQNPTVDRDNLLMHFGLPVVR